jgi:hypothetical protein
MPFLYLSTIPRIFRKYPRAGRLFVLELLGFLTEPCRGTITVLCTASLPVSRWLTLLWQPSKSHLLVFDAHSGGRRSLWQSVQSHCSYGEAWHSECWTCSAPDGIIRRDRHCHEHSRSERHSLSPRRILERGVAHTSRGRRPRGAPSSLLLSPLANFHAANRRRLIPPRSHGSNSWDSRRPDVVLSPIGRPSREPRSNGVGRCSCRVGVAFPPNEIRSEIAAKGVPRDLSH